MGSYRYKSLIEGLYTLNSPPVVSFKKRLIEGDSIDVALFGV